jgi:hypothetical protein
MRESALALAAMALVSLAGLAQAATLTGTENLPAATKDYSPVEKVGCGSYGRCPLGSHWACGPYGGCGCVSCGYVAPYVAPRVYVAPHPYYQPYRYRYNY